MNYKYFTTRALQARGELGELALAGAQMRYSVIWSPAHKLWLVYDREHGQYVDHSGTKAGAEEMAARRNLG